MKIIIAGGRNITNPDLIPLAIAESGFLLSEIISGGAKGVDALAENYAKEKRIPLTIIKADWEKYNHAAGPIRNAQMAKIADALIAIWDGKSSGTGSMIRIAKKAKLPHFIYSVN